MTLPLAETWSWMHTANLSDPVLSAGMKIATYANARTALEARKGVAPAFMTGERLERCSMLACRAFFCSTSRARPKLQVWRVWVFRT